MGHSFIHSLNKQLMTIRNVLCIELSPLYPVLNPHNSNMCQRSYCPILQMVKLRLSELPKLAKPRTRHRTKQGLLASISCTTNLTDNVATFILCSLIRVDYYKHGRKVKALKRMF